MLDLSKLVYKIYILRETGEELEVTDASSAVEWEENEGELALRASLNLANVLYKGTWMSSIAKPNCYVIVRSFTGSIEEEVARIKITEWKLNKTGNSNDLSVGGYDELFDLQASQESRYVREGMTTKSVVTSIFNDWGVPVEKYDGPDENTVKLTFKNEYLSDIVLSLLESARLHGSKDYIIRASKGKISIIPKGSNETIYCFEEGLNLELSNYEIDTSDVVTVVKVVAKNGQIDTLSVVEGNTEYGRRQKIYVRGDDESVATATTAAKGILKEEGNPAESMTVTAPDVPMIRKGDKVKVSMSTYNGFAIVKSIQHNASNRSMSMELEKYS